MVVLLKLCAPLMLEGFGVSNSGLIQQLLKNTAVVEAKLYLWDQLLWDVNCKATPLKADVKDMTGVLFPRTAGCAVFAHAGTTPQAQRPQKSGPQPSGLFLEPLLDIGGSFSFARHVLCVPQGIHACQEKNAPRSEKFLI
jgi:hypothetical protein